MADHGDIFFRANSERRMRQKVMDEDSLEMVLTNFNDQKVRAIRKSFDGKCSNWLNVIPMLRFGLVLCGREFRDAIA